MRLQPQASYDPEAVSVSLHVCSELHLAQLRHSKSDFIAGARLKGHARFVSTEKSLGLRTTISYRLIYV